MKMILGFLLLLCFFQAQAETIFINEIHYDNAGSDLEEGFEIAGPANADLQGWKVILYNGSNGMSYRNIDLEGVLNDNGDGFGFLFFLTSGIQNGPDALALIDARDSLIQFLSYEGSFTATDGPASGFTSIDIGVSESSATPVGSSLQLGGSGRHYEDFFWQSSATATAGLPNNQQTFESDPAADLTPPLLTLPDDGIIPAARGKCDTLFQFQVSAIDEQDGPLEVTCVPASGSAFPLGVTRVLCSATDSAGNTAIDSFFVTVEDHQAPAISCPAPINLAISPGQYSAIVHYDPPLATDNCSAVEIIRTGGLGSGSAFPIGTTIETYLARDDFGNALSCSFAVTLSYREEASGNISGVVLRDSLNGLPGILVSISDTLGQAITGLDTTTTDSSGIFQFSNISAGDYLINIFEPLGLSSNQNPLPVRVDSARTSEANFNLQTRQIGQSARSAFWWQIQLWRASRGKAGRDGLNGRDFDRLFEKVHGHYGPHFSIFEAATTLEDWRSILNWGFCRSPYERARRQVAALLLNLTSERISQFGVASEDQKTVGDVLAYVSTLLTSDQTDSLHKARRLAKQVNLGRQIASGLIPGTNIVFDQGQSLDSRYTAALETFKLDQNYPNPFNPGTTIRFVLPESQKVLLQIYNIRGQLVETLLDGYLPDGIHQCDWDAGDLPSGTYFYQLLSGERKEIRKMVLMR